MYLTLPAQKYSDAAAAEYFRELTDRLSRLPGVRSAAAEWCLPIAGCNNGWSIMLDGKVLTQISESPDARPDDVTPNYFKTMGMRMLKGRELTESDRAGAPPVVVINDAMAKQLWPGVDPVGHTLKMFAPTARWVTIVGVVGNVRARGFQKDPPPAMYFPVPQAATSTYGMPRGMSIVIRITERPESIVSSARAAVRSLDAAVAVSNIATLDEVVGNSIASRTFTTVLLAGFAALALLLAGVGIYGVIAYGVSERTYEIGVRMALGASGAGILRLIMREGVIMTAAGVAIGLAGAVTLDRLLRSMLVGVSGADGLTFAATSLALAIVAALACALPARRAASVSPSDALRSG
jgi:predicted permease